MKLTLLQLIAFAFVLGWVGGEVLGETKANCLWLGVLLAFIPAYLNNVHGLVWERIKRVFA